MFKRFFKPFAKLLGVDKLVKKQAGFVRDTVLGKATVGIEQKDYDSLLKRSNTLLSDPTLAQADPDTLLKEEKTRRLKVDPKKAKTLLEAIRARQGEVAARKGLTQTKTSILG